MKYDLALSQDTHCQYTVIHSSRAKYIRIKISPIGDIQLVIPTHTNNKLAHDFIHQRKDWISKCLDTVANSPAPKITIPTELSLNLLGEHWQIDYQETKQTNSVTLTQSTANHLLVTGQVNNKELVFNVLEKWLKRRAKNTFPNILDSLSTQCGMTYNRLTIRGQKTRWGSCSSKQNINLNYKLLFFPKDVVHYVFIHELCHTREMNHSKRFWNLVEKFDPDYKEHRWALKNPSDWVPAGL